VTRWTIWITSTYTGDVRELVAEYSNRGHAVAKLRGLRRRAHAAASEIQYALRRD